MTEIANNTQVVNNSEAHRYEIRTGERLVGFAEYSAGPDHIVFNHTEIDPEFGARGLGGALAQGALEDVRKRGLRAESQCSFIDHYVGKNPEHADLFAVHAPVRGSETARTMPS